MQPIITFILITLIVFTIPLILLRYFGKNYLIGLVPIYLLTANVFAESFFSVFGTIQSLAVPIYCGILLTSDILSEYYGKKESQKAVLLGFFGQLFFLGMMLLITNSEIFPEKLTAYNTTFTVIPRLIIGSMVAYIVSQFFSVYLYNKIWDITGRTEDGLAKRNIIATILAQFLDTTILIYIAFYGSAPFETNEKIWTFIISTSILKSIVALVDFNFMYLSKKVNNAK